jgi:hypothetical protein
MQQLIISVLEPYCHQHYKCRDGMQTVSLFEKYLVIRSKWRERCISVDVTFCKVYFLTPSHDVVIEITIQYCNEDRNVILYVHPNQPSRHF